MDPVVELHHLAPEGAESEGLTVTIKAREIIVAPGRYSLPADHAWVRQQRPPIGHAWEVPVEVRLPIPAADEPGMPWPYLTLAFNLTTQKAGVYLSHNGELPDHIRPIEFLAWRRPEDQGVWAVRHLHHIRPPTDGSSLDWHGGLGVPPPDPYRAATHFGLTK